MRDTITNLQKSGAWKVQLTIAINFISSKDADEEQVMHSKSDNIESITYDNANDFVDEPFETLFPRYQTGLEKLMRGSDFIFDSAQLLHYKRHKINFKFGGSYIYLPDCTKKKKATINPKDDKDVFSILQQLH